MTAKTLSPRMVEALQHVPDEWQPVKCGFRLGGEFIRNPLFRRTYTALRERKLIEFRCTKCIGWEWRRAQIATASKDGSRG